MQGLWFPCDDATVSHSVTTIELGRNYVRRRSRSPLRRPPESLVIGDAITIVSDEEVAAARPDLVMPELVPPFVGLGPVELPVIILWAGFEGFVPSWASSMSKAIV